MRTTVKGLRAEASSALLKQAEAPELRVAFLCATSRPARTTRLIANRRNRSMELPFQDSPYKNYITPRQRELLRLLGEGNSIREAAAIVSEKRRAEQLRLIAAKNRIA